MNDYQRIADDVRNSLYSASQENIDFMRAAAADYAMVCDQINDRLRQCGALLRDGLRTEAIQRSEEEPSLLDVVTVLDFPERPQWSKVMEQFGIVPAPPLLMDIAAELNDAYALEQPIAGLLARHRLLALAKAPIGQRLQTLWKLANVDTNNPVWQEDIATFEAARQNEIAQEVSSATRHGDFATLAQLEKELNNNDWFTPLNQTLIQQIVDNRKKLERKAALATLDNLAEELLTAYSDGNTAQGRAIRERWNEIAQAHQLAATDLLPYGIQSALEWLANEDIEQQTQLDFQDALTALERGLTLQLKPERLEELYRNVSRFGRDISPYLENRYHQHLGALKKGTQRNHQLRIAKFVGSALLGTLVVFLSISWLGNRISRSQSRDELVTNCEWHLDNEDLEAAESLRAKFPEDMDNESRVLNLDARIEAERKKRYQEQDAEFEKWYRIATSRGPESPRYTALQKAEEIAERPDQQERCREFREEIKNSEPSPP